LEAYAFPLIGAARVDHVDAPKIQSVLLPIWRAKAETARRVRQRIGAVLDYAHGQGWRETEMPRSAVGSLLKRIKQPKRGPGFAAIPYVELPKLMTTLRSGEPTAGRLGLRFLILTAARSGEVRGATWSEIDFEHAQWNIPAARMKVGDPHSVPLPAEAMEILHFARRLAGDRPDRPIFAGLKSKAMSDMTLGKALKAAGAGAYTVHGMRSAFRDWVAEQTDFPREWAEAALAHTPPNKVEAAYLRTKFVEQRRSLMAAWAEFLGDAA
jgi:integrase